MFPGQGELQSHQGTSLNHGFHSRKHGDLLDWILSAITIGIVLVLWLEYVVRLDGPFWNTFFHWYFLGIWPLFAAEFLFRLYRAPHRALYFRRNWIEAVIVFFPFLRLIRLFRPVEFAFVVIADRIGRNVPFFRVNRFFQILVFIIIAVALSSELILRFEAGYPESNIHSYGEAIWWSTIGISTIGIGNVVPVSAPGRALTLLLAIAGLFIFSVLTAQFADIFITEEKIQAAVGKSGKRQIGEENLILEKLSHIEERLAHIEQEEETKK